MYKLKDKKETLKSVAVCLQLSQNQAQKWMRMRIAIRVLVFIGDLFGFCSFKSQRRGEIKA